MKYIKLILILLLLTSCNNKNVSLKDDYYQSINKDIIEKQKDNYNIFKEKQEIVDKKINSLLLKTIESNNSFKEKQFNTMYHLIIDDKKRETYNIYPLNKYLELIQNSSNIEEFIDNSIYIEKELNIDIFTKKVVAKDYKNNKKNILYLYPISFDYGLSSDYYIDDDYLYYHAVIKKYNIRLLKELGYNKQEAKTIATNIDNLYKEISLSTKTKDYYNNIENYYNIKSIDDLKKIYTNIDINNYLSILNIPLDTPISIVDEENYKKINEILTQDKLSILKEIVKLKILQNYILYSSNDYSKIIYNLEEEILQTKKEEDKEEQALNILKSYFDADVNNIYIENSITKDEYDTIYNMINEVLDYYKENLNKNKFLSPKTKNKAVAKIDNITINIGKYNTMDYSENYQLDEKKSLIENIIDIKKTQYNYLINTLKDNKDTYNVSQITINAYYNPQDNSINIPVSLLSLYNKKDSYYKQLGSIGMIIAHEITHAIDPNGAKFDEDGNLNNWWTNKDYDNYKKIQKKVIKYYEEYEVLKGININGKLTLNENIADLGSISCITNLAQKKGASTKELKELYSSFANLWASKYSDDYKQILLLEDEHSPDKYRVNATLQSNDLFYKVYKISALNKMYLPKEERITIW